MQTVVIGVLPLFKNLQLFGEGGDGAGAAPAGDGQAAGDPGVTVPDAGEQKKARKAGRGERLPFEYGQPEENVDINAAPQPEPKPEAQEAQKESWEDVKKRFKKEYGEDVQNTIQQRFKGQKAEQAKASKMEQLLLRMGGAKYEGIAGEDGRLNLEALEKAVNDDDEYFEEAAAKRGLSVEMYKHVEQLEREKAEREQQDRDAAMYAEYQQVMAQAEKAKALFPNLDLNEEMDNPEFARLIRAHVPVETAYKVVHADQIATAMMQHTAQQQAMAISNTIQAGANRPSENGLQKHAAANVTRITDPRLLTREQRKDIRRRAARGEQIVW